MKLSKYKSKRAKLIIDILSDIAGTFLMAVSIHCFWEKSNIAPGGVSGIAIMLKFLFGLPVGLMTLIINIPLLILGMKFLGRTFTMRTIRALLISTFILDFAVTPYMPQYEGDRMLGAIFGGVFMGIGLGLIFMRGSTTGGVDILSCLIERKYPHIPIGKALMMIDSVILAVSALVFGNIETVLFGIVALYCQTQVINKLVYGADKGQQILCISEKNKQIADKIIKEIGRTATFLNAEGAYTGNKTSVLMCVIDVQEYSKIKKTIQSTDPKAFIIVSEATRIMGEGFRSF